MFRRQKRACSLNYDLHFLIYFNLVSCTNHLICLVLLSLLYDSSMTLALCTAEKSAIYSCSQQFGTGLPLYYA